ncbi:MAG: DUF3575 domain-containing protein [Bacteroidales bacterium]|nr:DUF3575 domain-containing protein [Bacteroidales bacterium]
MKKEIFILILLIFSATIHAQKVAVKNNLLYDATLTPNLGMEFDVGKKSTLDVNVGYNPFNFSNNKKFKHWLAQPEYRYWTCESFNGMFFGLHAHGGQFNIAGLKLPFGILPKWENRRFEGYFYGGGVSFGYQWILSNRWNIEASLGVGYARIHYDEYECIECGPKSGSDVYNYFGPTKLTLSFIYFIF